MKTKASLYKPVLALLLASIALCTGRAQMKGDHLLGDKGLKAGTQAPPSIALALPVYYYNASTFKNGNGDKVDHAPGINSFLTGLGISVTTHFKIFGGNWGATFLVPVVKNKVEIDSVKADGSIAFSDMYLQPISLGWTTKRADFNVGAAVYIPAGTYEAGASDNSGLGMWGYEFNAGSTVYFDALKTFNFSTVAFYEFHQKKKGTEMKVGDLITLSGGLNKDFRIPVQGSKLPMVIGVGAVYYMQFKVTDDTFPETSQPVQPVKDKIFAAGLEGNILFPKSLTAVSVRWNKEFGARSRAEGYTLFVTLSQVIKML